MRMVGEFDLVSAPGLHEALRHAIDDQRAAVLLVDLSGVTFMDCAGLAPLLDARSRLGWRLKVQHLPARIVRLLEESGTGQALLS